MNINLYVVELLIIKHHLHEIYMLLGVTLQIKSPFKWTTAFLDLYKKINFYIHSLK